MSSSSTISTESAHADRTFREWVSSTFGVTVPEAWDTVGEDDFTDWWNDRTGAVAPRSSTQNPDISGGQTRVTGPITALIDLLGSPVGEEAAATMSAVVGADVGDTLKSATRKLKPRGVGVEIARGKVETIGVHLGVGRGMFGIPPLTPPVWAGPVGRTRTRGRGPPALSRGRLLPPPAAR
ncbi:hypothetical protein [Pseudactinotalea sp.]|uniref:hypothetical protein n=1 Tax=Pseudactinotalea sp. TaxID=1926260 RepID=UPI003B3A31A8